MNPQETPTPNLAKPAASSVSLSAKQFDELLDAVRPDRKSEFSMEPPVEPRKAGQPEKLQGLISDPQITAPSVAPGWQTTEFWLTFTPTIVGLFLVALGVWKDHNILMVGGLGLLGIGQVPATTYNNSRSKVKAAASAAKAQVLSNGPKVLPLLLALPLLSSCSLWARASTVDVNTAPVLALAERVAERAVFAEPELAEEWNELRTLLESADTQPEALLWSSTAALCAGHDAAVVDWWLVAPTAPWKGLPLSSWRVWNFLQQSNSLRYSVSLEEIPTLQIEDLESMLEAAGAGD